MPANVAGHGTSLEIRAVQSDPQLLTSRASRGALNDARPRDKDLPSTRQRSSFRVGLQWCRSHRRAGRGNGDRRRLVVLHLRHHRRRGAMAIFPHPWPSPDAEAFAADHHAMCAVRRRQVDRHHPWSLSPAHPLVAPFVERLVLPSPNGSAIAATAAGQTVIAGCLRNASSVGQWLSSQGFGTSGRPVADVAAGERWPDGELRPALEDLLGAGSIIAAIDRSSSRSPEATTAEVAEFPPPPARRNDAVLLLRPRAH